MKRTILLFAVAFGLTIYGCGKESDADGMALLPGTWILSDVGVDYNGNGKIDDGKTTPVSATMLYDTTIYRQDATYTSHYDDGAGEKTMSGAYAYRGNRIYFISPASDSSYVQLTSLSRNRYIYNVADAWHVYTRIY